MGVFISVVLQQVRMCAPYKSRNRACSMTDICTPEIQPVTFVAEFHCIHCAALGCAGLCCAVLCCAALRWAALCCAVLCCAMLCCAVLSYAFSLADLAQVKVVGNWMSKIEGLLRRILKLSKTAPQEKCLVFSQYIDALRLVGKALTVNNIGWVELRGGAKVPPRPWYYAVLKLFEVSHSRTKGGAHLHRCCSFRFVEHRAQLETLAENDVLENLNNELFVASGCKSKQ